MAIQNAMNFIREAEKNNELRNSLYSVKQKEILPELAKLGYAFTYPEFEESINMMHVKCQTQEEADQLFQVVHWFKLLTNLA